MTNLAAADILGLRCISRSWTRASSTHPAALVQAIDSYIAGHNATPRPLVWTADLADILPKILRAHAALDTIEDQ